AFLRLHYQGASDYNQVMVMNSDATSVRAIMPCSDCQDSSPTWSPDGLTLAFSRYRPGSAAIYIVSVDGGIFRRMKTPFFYRYIAWSHAGDSLLSVHEVLGGKFIPGTRSRAAIGEDIFVVDVATGGERRITHLAAQETGWSSFCDSSGLTPVGLIREALWSPDDHQIAFVTNYFHLKQLGGAFDVVVVNRDGAEMRTVMRTKPVCIGAATYGRLPTLLSWMEY